MMIRLILGFVIIIIIILMRLPQFAQEPVDGNRSKIMNSKNYKNKKFQNIGGISTKMTPIKMLPLLPQWFCSDVEKTPIWTIPVIKRNKKDFEGFNDSLVRLTWLGHSSFLVEIDGKKLLIDPIFASSASPVPFFVRRFNKTLPMELDELPNIDAVIISHDHYDHLNYNAVNNLKDRVKIFYVPLGVASLLRYWGVPKEKIIELDWWDEAEFEGLKFVCTPAQHFSGRGLTDRNNTLWCSWVMKGKVKSLFFSGDSGYFNGFKEIGNKYGPFDVCMMECGQYNKLWQEIHMMPEQTAIAFKDLKGKVLVPMHWGSFSLSLHKWNEPVERLLKAGKKDILLIATPMIGESLIYPGDIPNKKWWINNL